MVCKISILLIAAVICFTWVEASPSGQFDENGCGPKEHLVDNNASCEPTCSNHQLPIICTRFGGPSCHYVSGYLRNSSGNCVKVEDCPKPPREVNPSDKYSENECGPIEHLVKNNPSCEPTCSHPRLVICSRVRFGGSGCYCIEGYLRNSSGKCVKVEDCPNIKRGNIIFPDN